MWLRKLICGDTVDKIEQDVEDLKRHKEHCDLQINKLQMVK